MTSVLAECSYSRSFRAAKHEVRAVWHHPDETCTSQPIERFDRMPMEDRAPDRFGVYVIHGSWIQDHPTRAAAEKHAAELNGDQS